MSTPPDGFQLYDLLGVTGPEAAALWPGDKFTMQRGFNSTNDSAACIDALNGVARFTDLRVGSDPAVAVGDPAKPGQITVSATVQILDVVENVDHIYYPRDLPDVGIKLLSTSPGKEPTVFFARDGRGWEVLIEGLPVELQWPPGLVTPAKDTDNQGGDDPNEFDHGDDDSVAVVTVLGAPSYIRAHTRLHLTPEGDVIIEPNTPISIDSAKFANLPVTALHDVLFIPSPRRRDLYEWARNDFASLVPGVPPGAYGFRSILFDLGKAPFADLVKRFQDPGSAALGVNNVELVVEDVVLPPSNYGFPLPTHGLFGIRRKITDRNDIEQAFSLSQAPYKVRVYSRDGQSDADHTGLYLVINQLEFRTGSFASAADYPPVLIFNAGLEWQNGWDENSARGGTLSVSDDWVLQAALTLGADSPLKLGSISDSEISINTIKGGLRLTTLDDPGNAWQALIDVSIRDTGVTMSGSAYPTFRIMSMTGKPLNMILRDIGWSFGRPHLGDSIAAPEGVQLVFAGVIRLIVEELGFVEEPAGGTYFSFSGGVEIGSARATSTQPSGARTDTSATGTGILFRRLRFLTSGAASLPPWKLDGIQLDIHYGQVSITGFGYITDDIESGYRYQEFGFGVQVKFPLMGTDFKVAAEFLKGSSTQVAQPYTSFSYLLASLQISWVPAGSFTLYAVRALFANNMQPALDPAGEGAQSMQLYQWHKDHDGAIDMPRSRNLADWKPLDDSFAAGIAVGFSFTSSGQLFHIGIFTLVTEGDPSMEILIVGELFLLKNPNSIGLLAVDYDVDTGKFGVLIGVNLGLDKFVGGTVPSWIADLAKLTGTVFFGNQPWTLAIGQLSDQRSWLGITVSSDLLALNLKFRIALGLQIVDGGPKGFGVATSFTGGANWGIGKIQVYGSLGFLWGPWKTGSDTSAVHLWLQFGIKMSVFYVFSVGLEVDGDLTYLTRPGYWLYSAQIHIDTPWFLPDVSFSISGHSYNSSQPMDSPLLNAPLNSGDAGSGGAGSAAVAMHVPALSDGNTDPNRLYSLNELNQVTGASIAAVVLPDDLVAVAVDADIAITFTNPLANDAAIATQSYPVTTDPGLQKVQDLSVRYALKSVQIQRRPRFGGGDWTDLLSVVDTALDQGGNVHAAPAVSFSWDADSRADGVVSPNRLLINCRTPYSVVTGSSQNDEEALGNDDGFPCCQLDPVKGFQIPWHDLSWTTAAPGFRLPASEAFSSGGALWSWTAPPATMNGVGAYSGRIVAVDLLDANTLRGSVDLTDPAVTFTAQILPMSTRITCTLTAYHGLTALTAQTVTATANPAAVTLAGSVTTPITRVTLTALVTTSTAGTALAVANPWGPLGVPAVMVYDMQYQSLSDVLSVMGRRQRCRNSGTTSGVGGLGKLAFLPNYDYAVIPTVELTVSHATGGSKTISLSQPSFFRTKGLPGLNATPNVGDELQPYVASTYPPARSVPLYRNEPVALAFTEDMSNLLPVDRVAAPGDPPEKAQLMQLALSVDRVASTEGAVQLTSPGPDWLTAHGGPVRVGPPFHNEGFATLALRRAASQQVQVQRFEAVLGAAGCTQDTLHSSQVLLHAPVSPDGTAETWEAQANLRATVRAQDGPYTERTTFAAADLGAFTYLADAGTGPVWTLNAGTMVAPGGGRTYAAFGDPDWNHFQMIATIDPADGVAGAGVGVSGSDPVQQAMLAVIDHGDLVLVRRVGGADQELARAAFSGATGPITLHVTAFDDRLRAAAGDAVLEADRGPVREGRAALVSTGQAVFSGLLVESLDMYGVDFVTSRYLSFADHIASRDPLIHQHEADAMGAPPAATPAAALADHAAEIAAAMTPAADPQQRQQFFSQLLGDIGLAQLQRCDRLTLTRLADASTTTALLLESPEPLSILYDTTLSMVHHTTQKLPHPVPVGPPTPITNALAAIQDIHGQLVAPAAAANTLVANHDAVVLITAAAPDFSMTVYQVPSPAQHPQVKLTPVKTYNAQSATQDGFGALTKRPVGMMLAVRPDHSVAGAVNTMGPVDVPVALTLLTNGDETATMALPASPLAPGGYALTFGFHRTRWETNVPDPQAVYDDAATVELVV
jgi:hypothetical protein